MDLKGATLVNNLASYGTTGQLVRDARGKIIRSKGPLQNLIFHITDRLNLRIETTDIPGTGA